MTRVVEYTLEVNKRLRCELCGASWAGITAHLSNGDTLLACMDCGPQVVERIQVWYESGEDAIMEEFMGVKIRYV